jgi:NAD(P)-dependent dehydrogenase (short-subunit alcohol dehydrogenase family)
MAESQQSVALVTGGSSGIGRATALAFAKNGARVVVSDVSIAGGEETVRMIMDQGGDALFVDASATLEKPQQ